MRRPQTRALFSPLRLLLGVAMAASLSAQAHEIPNDVTIQTIVKPDDDRIVVLLRAPLEAMQDIEFPVTGPGYLDFERANQQLRNAARVWLLDNIRLFENGEAVGPLEIVAVRASIPSDRSFLAYESALAHVHSPPLPTGTPLVWQQALLDVQLEAGIRSTQSDFSIDAAFERLGLSVITVIRYFSPSGTDRVFEISGNSGLQPLDPGAFQAALRFLVQGFEHILDGSDHLLFLLCLVIPFRHRLKSLIWIATAFTLAHSVTLIGSAYGLAPDALWFPSFVEMLIAVSILYMAIENAIVPSPALRSGIAFGFGLIHGFGFSFALRNTLQFAGDHVLTSLLSFNVGVELGQILVLVIFVLVLSLVFRIMPSERVGVVLLSVIVGHTAWHWTVERYAAWRAFDVTWAGSLRTFASGPRLWLLLAFALAGAALILWRRNRASTLERGN
jgi:hypothetical protein